MKEHILRLVLRGVQYVLDLFSELFIPIIQLRNINIPAQNLFKALLENINGNQPDRLIDLVRNQHSRIATKLTPPRSGILFHGSHALFETRGVNFDVQDVQYILQIVHNQVLLKIILIWTYNILYL